MKMKLIFWMIISGFILAACIDDTTKMGSRTVSNIMIESEKDTFLYELGDEVRIAPVITQDIKERELSYEWRYRYMGKLETGEPDSLKFLPCKEVALSDLTHFRRLGQYTVRLRASNEDGSSFYYFTVYIRSSHDKGLMVLSKDENKKGRLSFLRVMQESDLLKDNGGVFQTNVFEDVNPGVTLKNPTDMLFWKTKKEILFAQENDGLYFCDQSLAFLFPMNWETPLKADRMFTGNNYNFLWTPEKGVFRISEDAVYGTNWSQLPISKVCYTPFYGGDASIRDYVTFIDNENGIIYGDCDRNTGGRFAGKEIINMATNGTSLLVVLKDKNTPGKVTISFCNTWDLRPGGYADYTYEPKEMTLTSEMEVVSEPGYSKNAFYFKGNKLYRWATSGSMPDLPIDPSLTVDGEITCLSLSENWKYLYIGVYNPTSGKELKGSVWIMDAVSLNVVKKYDYIADRPVKILYKENQ